MDQSTIEASAHLQMQRRADDRDRQLIARLEHLERQVEQTQQQVRVVENSVGNVKTEQAHMREVIDLRLRMIEKGADLHAKALDEIKELIAAIAGDPEKTPAGRQTLNTLKDHDRELQDLVGFKNQAVGALSTLQWFGWAGLLGLVLSIVSLAIKFARG